MTAPDTSASAGPPAVDTKPPIAGLIALFLLDLLVGVWVKLHASQFAVWIGSNIVLLGAFAVMWKALPEDMTKAMRKSFALRLRSRRVVTALWTCIVLFVVFTMFVTTIRVVVPANSAAISMYRVDIDNNSANADATAVSDSALVDAQHLEHVFFVRTAPLGTSYRFHTSTNKRSMVVHAWPWIPAAVHYPDNFGDAMAVYLFLMGDYNAEQFQGPLKLVVTIDSGGRKIIDDTVRTGNALRLSHLGAVTLDSLTRKRWADLATREFPGIDRESLTPMLDEWMKVRSLKAFVPLDSGMHVKFTLLSSANVPLASDVVTLIPNADVILHRLPPPNP